MTPSNPIQNHKETSYGTSLFVFRRDMRLEDNSALLKALKTSKKVQTCFIFDPRQISENNEYRSLAAVQFMVNSLKELQCELGELDGQLNFLYGKSDEVLTQILSRSLIEAIFLNRDYTPFSIQRDQKIQNLCVRNNIAYHCTPDYLLHEPEDIEKNAGGPYSVFTPYYKKAQQQPIDQPKKLQATDFSSESTRGRIQLSELKELTFELNERLKVKGGRAEALQILQDLTMFDTYEETRDFPALDATTHLSAHLKFGTVSIREVYFAMLRQLGQGHPLIRQLYWRDFFTHVAFHFPHVFGQAYREKYTNLVWSTDMDQFKRWKEGKTGFPIVDAGMRQLNQTGYMHNRVRMIVASFLTKDLHISWQWGEQYFAQKLVDYDPSVNNGNWQWAASTGTDAQPYFRIFNPWSQQTKYDKDCVYIKKWVPELRELSAKQIHGLKKKRPSSLKDYPEKIVIHSVERKAALEMFKSVSSSTK